MPSVPLRRCVGCARSRPRGELVRFVATKGSLRPWRSGGGRGVYLCPERDCLRAALKKKGLFSRALRAEVAISDEKTIWSWMEENSHGGALNNKPRGE